MLGLLLVSALSVEIPLLGEPLKPEVVEELGLLPGVAGLEVSDDGLRIEVAPGRAVRFAEIQRTIRRHTVATELDSDRIPLGRQTVFQMDAGQCFHCSEAPLRKRLSRKNWVEKWAVVDYAPRGRMLFRIEPREGAYLEDLGQLPFEDILFTERYHGIDEVSLDWPTGGVAWRPSEAEARRQAMEARKPLLFFPTAGT